MSEERLDRIENLLTQLIQMVAQNNKTVHGFADRFDSLEQRFESLEQRFDNLEQRFEAECELNKQRHYELLGYYRNLNADIEYLRNQSAKHDMELHKLLSR
jgi:archaellum component FlaC